MMCVNVHGLHSIDVNGMATLTLPYFQCTNEQPAGTSTVCTRWREAEELLEPVDDAGAVGIHVLVE